MARELVKAVTGREEKTIGIELEIFVHDTNELERAINAAGVKAKISPYGHSVPRGFWKIISDGSLDADASPSTENMVGRELVSPPLPKAKMEEQVRIICAVLKEIGAKINKTCGLHVHHDINDLNLDQIKNVYRLYVKHEKSIETFFPESRRAAWQNANPRKSYCKPVSRIAHHAENASSIEELKRLLTDNEPRGQKRYHSVNFCSYIAYGTIEFRQHAGTIDADKILNWVAISQAIVAAAAKKKKVAPLSAHMATRENLAFTRDVYIEGTQEAKFFEKRRAELKREAV